MRADRCLLACGRFVTLCSGTQIHRFFRSAAQMRWAVREFLQKEVGRLRDGVASLRNGGGGGGGGGRTLATLAPQLARFEAAVSALGD